MSVSNFRTGVVRLVLLVLALCCLGGARAQEIPGYPTDLRAFDRREVALLPRYCVHTQLFRSAIPGGNNAAEINRWTAQMGEIFHHMHHYCFGLMNAHRGIYLARNSMTRDFYLNNAVAEYNYVLERAAPDFVLLPEVHTKKGEAFVRLSKSAMAVAEFERAIELKPDYWPPYARLSELFEAAGDRERAKQIIDQGLREVPDSKALRRRLDELAGSGRSGKR